MKSRREEWRHGFFIFIATRAPWGETERARSRSEGVGGNPLLGLAASLLLSLAQPQSARAWADASAETASATLTLDVPRDSILVEWDMVVNIRGGWLERFEVATQDRILTVEEGFLATLLEERDGAVQERPLEGGRIASASDRTIEIRFPKRFSPTRGRVHFRFRYSTPLSEHVSPIRESRGSHVHWVFPAFQAGIGDAQVTIRGGQGLRPVDAATERTFHGFSDLAGAEVETSSAVDLIAFKRVHLPRTLSWAVHARMDDVVAATLAQDEAQPETINLPVRPNLRVRPDVWSPLFVAVVLLFCLLAFEARARKQRVVTRPVVPLHKLVRAAMVLVLAGASFYSDSSPLREVLLGGALLALAQKRARPATAPLGVWRSISVGEEWALQNGRSAWKRRVPHWTRLSDGTTPAGLLVVAALAWAGSRLPISNSAYVIALAAFFLGTRYHLPLLALEKLARLTAFAAGLRLSNVALSRAVYEAHDGYIEDARLRLILAERPRGLLRLDIDACDRSRFVGVLVTRNDSFAESLVRRHLKVPGVQGASQRLARVLSAGALVRLAERLERPEKLNEPAPILAQKSVTPPQVVLRH